MINNYPIVNIYEKNSLKSKLSSQILFGEKFKILSNKKGWLKVKTSYDKYIGFIEKRKFFKNRKSTHKILSLNASLYTKPSKYHLIKTKLPFCSKISVTDTNKNFYKFEKYWIKKSDVVPINYKQKIFRNINIFKNTPYK